MFFIASKILAFLIKPLVWVMFFLCLALWTKKTKRKRLFVLLGIFSLWFFSNTLVFEWAMSKWEKPTHAPLTKYDFGIVLGGMSYYNEALGQICFLRSADRLWQAVDQYQRGRVKKLFISGGSGSLLHTEKKVEAEMLRNYLVQLGIPSKDIWFEKESKNTRENAVNTVASLQRLGRYNCLLFTSAFHQRRATACFLQAGLAVDWFATDSYVSRPRNFFGRLLIPNDEALRGWTILLKEITGYIVYKLVGYA